MASSPAPQKSWDGDFQGDDTPLERDVESGDWIMRPRQATIENNDFDPSKLLSVLANVQNKFIEQSNAHDIFAVLLRGLLTATNSEYGFIGEILHDEETGAPFLRTHGITNISWNEATDLFYKSGQRGAGLEFRNLNTLFGAVISSGELVLSNDCANDPRAGGVPPGHPPLNYFLGLPFHKAGTMVGMVGIANRPGGYDRATIDYLQPLLSTCGNLIGAFRLTREKEAAEKKLQDALHRTEELVAARTAELTEAKKRAESASLAKTRFLASMSHEIRTPLNGVLGMTSLLAESPLTEEQRLYSRIIQSSGESLTCVINDILDFTKMEAGMLSLQPASMNVHRLCLEVAKISTLMAHAKAVEISVDVDADVPTQIFADSARLRQILMNLVSNSVKFTSMGSIAIVCRLLMKRSAGADDDPLASFPNVCQLAFRVEDTGAGIRDTSVLFRPFSQDHHRQGGTGLGLVISRQLAEMMKDGTLELESTEVGRGSVFVMTATVPCSDQVGDSELKQGDTLLKGKHALVSVGSKVVELTFQKHLSGLGCTVEVMPSPVSTPHPSQLPSVNKNELSGGGGAGKDAIVEQILDTQGLREHISRLNGALAARDAPLLVCDSTLYVAAQREAHDLCQNWGSEFKVMIARWLGEHVDKVPGSVLLTKPFSARGVTQCSALLFGDTQAVELELAKSRAEHSQTAPLELARQIQILVVDDNETNLIVMSDLLRKLTGRRPDCLDSGFAAVEQIAKRHAEGRAYDLVFMDGVMPGMDGYTATRLIRQQEELAAGSGVYIVLLTADIFGHDETGSKEAGCDELMNKPVQIAQLRAVIGKLGSSAGEASKRRAPDMSETVGEEEDSTNPAPTKRRRT